jgi:phosphoglycolate phosphatase
MPPDILFDLDGTLIDSSPGILASFQRVLDANGLRAVVPLEASLIGPPLGETLRRISGIEDDAVLSRLTEAFKQDYDTTGYRQTHAFEGVPEGLRQLAEAGSRLFIVTNKRMVPTRKILDALGLARYFTGVHTRDETVPMASSKSAVTRRVVTQYSIACGKALFVGDSDEDAAAAGENHLRYIHAVYGYGTMIANTAPEHSTLRHFPALPELIGI